MSEGAIAPIYCDRCEEQEATCTMTLLFTNSLDAMQFLCGRCLVYNVDDWRKNREKGETFIIERMEKVRT